jgi:acid stress chaperone HdeB
MRKLFLCLAVAAAMLPGTGHAQVTLDTSRITCAQLLAMSPEQGRDFGAFMSGWFNQRFGYVTVGLADYARNTESVRQWCASYPQQTVMSGLERSNPQPAAGGQITIDMSLVTCRQYQSSDRERRDFIAYWMSGYFRASRSQPVFDFERFARNRRAVDNYCKSHGGETVMSAIQKNAR